MVQSVQMNISNSERSEMACFIATALEYAIREFMPTLVGGIECNRLTSDPYVLFIKLRHKYYKEKQRRYVSQ